jgi:hypothetical protein
VPSRQFWLTASLGARAAADYRSFQFFVFNFAIPTIMSPGG